MQGATLARCARLRQALASALCAACVVAAASAQSLPGSLRIPDLRQPAPVGTAMSRGPCVDCGYVSSVREVALERRGSVPVAFAGGSRAAVEHNLVGAVIYLPLSSSNVDKPFVGGVGTPEMRERFGESSYAVTVRLDDGTSRIVQRTDGTRFQAGDRVRLVGTSDLELVVP